MFKIKMKLLGGVINSLRRSTRSSPEALTYSEIKTVIIMNNKRLGDFLFCTPAIKALKDANPSINLIAVTSPNNEGLIVDCPYIDEVIYMQENMSDAIRVGRELRFKKAELGIIFHSKCPYDIVVMTLSRVSCLMKHYFGNERKVLLNACDAFVLGGDIPPVQNDLLLVSKLNINTEDKKMFYPSPVAKKQNESLSIGLQLGASGKDRQFPIDKAAQVVEKIHTLYPECKFHLIGSKSERLLAKEFFMALKGNVSSNVISHIGETSLQELANLINNFTVLITPDTGSLHIATALQTKTVSLFTLKQQKASIPQQDRDLHQVLYASDYHDNKNSNSQSKLSPIPVTDIVAAILRILH